MVIEWTPPSATIDRKGDPALLAEADWDWEHGEAMRGCWRVMLYLLKPWRTDEEVDHVYARMGSKFAGNPEYELRVYPTRGVVDVVFLGKDLEPLWEWNYHTFDDMQRWRQDDPAPAAAVERLRRRTVWALRKGHFTFADVELKGSER